MATIPDHDSADRPLIALRSRALRGRFKVAPDPTLFSIAAILAALARGRSVLYHDAGELDANLAATLRLLEAVGARPEIADDRWEIDGLGPLGLLAPERPIDFSGAGPALPLALALLGSFGFETRLVGELPPGAAPLGPALNALRRLGIVIREQRSGQLPLVVKGPQTAVPFATRLDTGSIEIKAALMLAALSLPGASSLTDAQLAPDHVGRLMQHFGARIEEKAASLGTRTIAIGGLPALGARTLSIAGDPDLAMLPVLAALIVPDSEVLVENVLLHPERNAVLHALEEMGGDIEILDRRAAGGEMVGDLRVQHSPLLGMSVDPAGLSAAALPPLAIAGAFAAGETHIPRRGFAGEAELHRRLAAALAGNGARATVGADGLRIGRPETGRRLGGETVSGSDNPFFSAAFMIFGLGAADQVTIDDNGAARAAFPDLVPGLEALGAEFSRRWAA